MFAHLQSIHGYGTLALLSIAAAFPLRTDRSQARAGNGCRTESRSAPDEQIQQVLNRLNVRTSVEDAAKVRAMGVEKWIDAQLHPERISDSRIDSLMSKYAVYSMSMGDVIRDYGVVQQLQRQVKKEAGADTSMDKRMRAAKCFLRIEGRGGRPSDAAVRRRNSVGEARAAVNSERQLNEVMVDFWENHFSVFAGKGSDALLPRELRPRRHSAARARQIPRPARRRGEESGDAVLPRQCAERGGQHAATLVARNGGRGRGGLIARRPGLGGVGRGQQLPPRRASDWRTQRRNSANIDAALAATGEARPERKLCARADGASHARR
jgi:hypothetical protein